MPRYSSCVYIRLARLGYIDLALLKQGSRHQDGLEISNINAVIPGLACLGGLSVTALHACSRENIVVSKIFSAADFDLKRSL